MCVSRSLSEATLLSLQGWPFVLCRLWRANASGGAKLPEEVTVLPPRTFGTLPLQYYAPDVAKVQKEGGKFPWRFFFLKRDVYLQLSPGLLSSMKSPLIHTWNHWNIIHASIIWCILVVSFSYLEMRLRPSSMETCGDPSQSGSSEMCRCDVMGVKTKTGHADSPRGCYPVIEVYIMLYTLQN